MTLNTLETTWQARITLFHDHAGVEIQRGAGVVDKQVSIDSLGPVFANIPVGTGLLPQNVLFYERQEGERVGIYIEPGRHKFMMPKRTYDLPMPGFVFVGKGKSYQLYAVKPCVWPQANTRLYYAPMTNIMNGGNVCAGTVKVPTCTVGKIWQAWTALKGAYFTPHAIENRSKTHKSILEFWDYLETVDEFPYDELLPMKTHQTVNHLLRDGR